MPTTAGFHTFLFDLDGTLIDHFAAIHRCHAYATAKMGLPVPTEAQVRSAVGGGIERAVLRFVPRERLAEAMALYRECWERTLLDDVRLMPGALDLLNQLRARGAFLAVVSNKLGTSSRRICGHLGIEPLFQAIVGAGDTPWIKPAPELTRFLLERTGDPAPEAILIGDSTYDVAAAHAGAIPAWCVTTGTHNREELLAAGADRVFADLPELARALPPGERDPP